MVEYTYNYYIKKVGDPIEACRHCPVFQRHGYGCGTFQFLELLDERPDEAFTVLAEAAFEYNCPTAWQELAKYNIWEGRAPESFANALNNMFSELGLPYDAKVFGIQECYETVRYGQVCRYKNAVVVLYRDGKPLTNDKVKLQFVENLSWYDESQWAVHEHRSADRCRLTLPGVTIEFELVTTGSDYMYKYRIKNPRVENNKM